LDAESRKQPTNSSSIEDYNDINLSKRKRGRPKVNNKRMNKSMQSEEHCFSDFLVCEICNTTLKTKKLLERHLTAVHRNENKLKCVEYNKDFKIKNDYRNHVKEMHCEKLYTCPKCPKMFTAKVYLQGHLMRHEAKRYHCRECTKSFKSRDQLKAHKKAECGLICKTKNRLTVNLGKHKGKNPFKFKFSSKAIPRIDDESNGSCFEDSNSEVEENVKCNNFIATIEAYSEEDFKSHMGFRRSTVDYLICESIHSNFVIFKTL